MPEHIGNVWYILPVERENNMFNLKKIAGFFPEGMDSGLLKEAFTHRSFAVEHKLDYDNQRLEFLGDAVIETVLSEFLFKRYPGSPEGDLTKMRSALVCEAALARLARCLELGSKLRIGNGEIEAGGAFRDSTLADLFEAVIGALFLGAGFEVCKELLTELFEKEFPDPQNMLVELNPKGKLQELSQHLWNRTPGYRIFRQYGPQHNPFYEVELRLQKWVAYGSGKNRKSAEFDAAKNLYNYLNKIGIKF